MILARDTAAAPPEPLADFAASIRRMPGPQGRDVAERTKGRPGILDGLHACKEGVERVFGCLASVMTDVAGGGTLAFAARKIDQLEGSIVGDPGAPAAEVGPSCASGRADAGALS